MDDSDVISLYMTWPKCYGNFPHLSQIRMLTTSLFIVNQAYRLREKVSGAEKIILKKCFEIVLYCCTIAVTFIEMVSVTSYIVPDVTF